MPVVAGVWADCSLPPKKSFGTKNQDFMEEKRDALEQYLQVGTSMYGIICVDISGL